jgi:hypothetical protein
MTIKKINRNFHELFKEILKYTLQIQTNQNARVR